jgi:hypothetical protein
LIIEGEKLKEGDTEAELKDLRKEYKQHSQIQKEQIKNPIAGWVIP